MMMTAKEQGASSAKGKLTATPAPERPGLSRLIEESKAKLALMSPDEKEAMFLAQRQNWAVGDMGLDRKTGAANETRIMAAIEEARPNASLIEQPTFDVASIPSLVEALRFAEMEFNLITCEDVSETKSAADALDRVKAFADLGAIAVREALSGPSSGGLKVDASDIGRVLRVLIDENPDKHEAALEKPSLRGWFVGQIVKKFEGNVAQDFVSDLVETVFEFTAPVGQVA
jgi:hypothetical protein